MPVLRDISATDSTAQVTLRYTNEINSSTATAAAAAAVAAATTTNSSSSSSSSSELVS